tara:strand:- start:2615 stop:3082 length:468 start_codon:yes stop_codon:yes gene_type:complete
MTQGPHVKLNPLKVFVSLLVVSLFFDLLFTFDIRIPIFLNIIGFFFLLIFFILFFVSARMFIQYNEKLPPHTPTERIIKTGIYSYSRNPIYLAFIGFHFSMFMVFENIWYLLSSIVLFFWINNYVIVPEEQYLEQKFNEEYTRYKKNVSRWISFR